jgi:hypothetical protein
MFDDPLFGIRFVFIFLPCLGMVAVIGDLFL